MSLIGRIVTPPYNPYRKFHPLLGSRCCRGCFCSSCPRQLVSSAIRPPLYTRRAGCGRVLTRCFHAPTGPENCTNSETGEVSVFSMLSAGLCKGFADIGIGTTMYNVLLTMVALSSFNEVCCLKFMRLSLLSFFTLFTPLYINIISCILNFFFFTNELQN